VVVCDEKCPRLLYKACLSRRKRRW